MTIRYAGREMPCFMRRNTDCGRTAEVRYEDAVLLLHFCRPCGEAFQAQHGGTLTELAPAGETDVIEANSLDDASLRTEPHIRSVTSPPSREK